MDLSTRCISSETFEYRHKKFDHVRSSPNPVDDQMAHAPVLDDEERSKAGTPCSSISNSTCRRAIKRELDDDDDFDLLWTPTKRQRIQSRSSRSKRSAALELCGNAPKKRKCAPRATTPEKYSENAYASPNLLPKISKEALERICQYNSNMVRKFPKRERTPKDQERRDKNTIACRMSRRLKKLENLAVEEQYKIFIQEYLDHSRQTMHAAVYLNELLKFDVKVPQSEQNEKTVECIAKKLSLHFLEGISTNAVPPKTEAIEEKVFRTDKNELESVAQINVEGNPHKEDKIAQEKKSFSIAFLLGVQHET